MFKNATIETEFGKLRWKNLVLRHVSTDFEEFGFKAGPSFIGYKHSLKKKDSLYLYFKKIDHNITQCYAPWECGYGMLGLNLSFPTKVLHPMVMFPRPT